MAAGSRMRACSATISILPMRLWRNSDSERRRSPTVKGSWRSPQVQRSTPRDSSDRFGASSASTSVPTGVAAPEARLA
ncbi:hypothetical protein D3C72_1819400 [compost metagenome]